MTIDFVLPPAHAPLDIFIRSVEIIPFMSSDYLSYPTTRWAIFRLFKLTFSKLGIILWSETAMLMSLILPVPSAGICSDQRRWLLPTAMPWLSTTVASLTIHTRSEDLTAYQIIVKYSRRLRTSNLLVESS